MAPLTSIFPLILTGLVVALLVSRPAAWLANRLGLVDVPGQKAHKQHAVATPMAGGIALAAALAVSVVRIPWSEDRQIAGILLGGLVVFVFGLLDDRFDLSVPLKLLGQISAAVILITLGIRVSLFAIPMLDLVVTILWVLGIINAFNFVDSMDGLALGLAGIAATFFLLAAIDSGQGWIAAISAAIVGSCLGAFVYNMLPSKSFLGDSGSQLLGFLMAAVGLAYIPRDFEQSASWYVPILVLGVPLFDMVLVIVSRLRRGRPVYQAGSDHTYHRLRLLHIEPTRAVFLMHLTGMSLGLLAFVGLQSGPVLGNLILGAVLFTGLTSLWLLERFAPPAG
jgi:UDP-GlcNAc:undecaprenyl-phosphate GlcNAc-1-phosphate transferase